ncbi:ATP-binding cassette domain-containing protein [Peribacillus sp. Hz7]|uniref:ATP-binding cassette domain-containing protein n=1 Tax=Peribacillus sp. Hz7 TaxID=3344873 RepID=UPI0035CA609D
MLVLEKVVYKGIINLDYLEMKSGVVTCLVGESGAGKTTLLRLLNRMKDIDSGKILSR